MAAAVQLKVQTFSAECPCGGSILETENYSYQLEPQHISLGALACDSCNATITIKSKTARI